MRARRRVHGRARARVLAAAGAAAALAAAILTGGGAAARAATPATSAPATPGAATAAARHAQSSAGWVPPTPTYWPQVVGEQATRPVTVTRGVQEYAENYQTVGGAQNAQVMDVNLTDPNVHFGMVEAGNELVDPADETISSMASRTGAVAGVNADEFAINTTGQPMGMVVQDGVLKASPVASWPAEVEVLNNGQFEFTTETFAGTADDTTSGSGEALAGVNRIDQKGLVVAGSFLGAAPISSSVVATATQGSTPLDLTITSVTSGVTSLPQLAAGQEDLFAAKGSAAAAWLTSSVHAGDSVILTESVAPYGIGTAPTDVATAVSGAAFLVQNGQMAVPATGGGENNVDYPVVGIGVTKDGQHAIMVVFNGREAESVATGLTRPQEAQWFMAHGIYNAIEFDSGGSAEMVARLPGQQQVSVLNTPSDGHERDVANGLFIYTTEASPGAAVGAVVNGGSPMTVLDGTTEQVSAYATDADGNPASDPVQVSVQPPGLATVSGTSLTAEQPGRGRLVVRAGRASAAVPLTVAVQYGQQVLQSFGLPYHTAVGDSDIGQGAYPENTNWTAVFGDTHYSYSDGDAEFIVDDSAWEGLLASDPYQVPDEEQYAWLVSQLSASTSKVIFVVTHASPYDPHPIANSQFTDRYEAQMYEQLLANYQASHPWAHVILLNGQARGVAEQVINPLGSPDPRGLPNFDVADAGVTPYAPTNQGGFYNFVLFHVLADGTVQFAVQPVLAGIAVTAPQASVAAGTREQLSATGTTPTGDDLTALQVPIADPASHQWSSSDPRVAAVNPQTGELYARSPGTATISVLSGGVTGTVTITVT
jgi:hypothetical protein